MASKYKGRVVLSKDWLGTLECLIDGCNIFPLHQLNVELSLRFLGGDSGTLYLEPLTKDECEHYASWISEICDDDPQQFQYADKDEMLHSFVDLPMFLPADLENPRFIELDCGEVPRTRGARRYG